ncbi:hypothetical protein LMG31884_47580 (plasmid) [Xanthomonas hydrangeae]|uniref:hypothetical protein n=1 Tax=Xanthomonas hydrangeae TaxID=2775159 RepID=UPI001963B663|nr:hypothetical protein LMG31884_47580 [Xanthomonas hydrangeae]CAD7741342.1 hypothetical protein LMG31884_47580 [Xanthomonas hydrangeae]CAD7747908.1 hypothetical protein LMG31887_46250 [Xanthomonas hydrangeae]CAD7747909.1 hypothetical protein LMG31887_46250 [Xanthomonas hydrangeae]CAD7748214.1 hypothetical protein LMG31885_45240 [Xanthomonas hydrangeae]
MAAAPLKPIKMYLVAGKLRERNRIYEAELHQLLKQQAVRQLVITCHQDDSFSLAVLADHRADYAYRPYERVGSKVLKLRPVSIEQEGFAPLFSVRNKAIRKYRNLDTLVRGLQSCGQLPPTYLRQGK